MRKWLVGILATWVTLAIPAIIVGYASATAEEAAEAAIEAHVERPQHDEINDLKAVQAAQTEKLASLKDDTSEIKDRINQLLKFELERRRGQ